MRKIFCATFLILSSLTQFAFADCCINDCCHNDCCWSGFYVGVHGGYAWGRHSTNFDPLPDAISFEDLRPTCIHTRVQGGFGGAQIGYNWQMCSYLLGLEADFSGGDIHRSRRVSPIIENNGTPYPSGFLHVRRRLSWFGTVRARLGYVFCCKWLIYATGGLAYGHTHFRALANPTSVGTEIYETFGKHTRAGWTVGAGIEYAFACRLSLRAEYLFIDLGRFSKTAPWRYVDNGNYSIRNRFDTQYHLVRLGLNYRFCL